MPPATPKRRWSFSLRTLFVLVTVMCVWLGYHANWIRQRRAFRESHPKELSAVSSSSLPPYKMTADAPWALRLLGEQGVSVIVLEAGTATSEKQHIQVLFPEARTVVFESRN